MNPFIWLIEALIELVTWVVIASAIISWLVAFGVVNMRNQFIRTVVEESAKVLVVGRRSNVGGETAFGPGVEFEEGFVPRRLGQHGLFRRTRERCRAKQKQSHQQRWPSLASRRHANPS